jgi:hypothetical protein
MEGKINRGVYDTHEIRTDAQNRKYTFVISTETRDRHGTIIKMDSWDLSQYEKNPIVAYMHKTDGGFFSDPEPDHLLGVGRVWKENGKLMGEVHFEDEDTNPFAEKIRKKIDHGTIRATSVGFRSKEGHWGDEKRGEDIDTYYFDHAELMEFSIVHVPSNPDALKRSIEIETKKPPVKENKDIKKCNRAGLVRANKLFINKNFKNVKN